MDRKESHQQWLALSQRMKLHAEQLYGDWRWFLRDSDYDCWITDVMALKARQVDFDEEGRVVCKRGIVIRIPEEFSLRYSQLPRDDGVVLIKSILRDAIADAREVPPSQRYPEGIATIDGWEYHH